jgi:hypothetical protein
MHVCIFPEQPGQLVPSVCDHATYGKIREHRRSFLAAQAQRPSLPIADVETAEYGQADLRK